MISSLSFQNFKSWRAADQIRLSPITALFGTNSSGKSSVLQLLLMLKQTTESPDRRLVLHLGDTKSPVELGGFRDIIHKHDLDRVLSFSIEWQPGKTFRLEQIADPDSFWIETSQVGFSSELGWSRENGRGIGSIQVKVMQYHLAESAFGMELTGDKAKYDLFCHTEGMFQFKRSRGRAWPLPPPSKFYGFPDEIRAYYTNAEFLSDLELAFEQLFSGMYYLGPLREYPKRQYAWAGNSPADMGQRGEKVIDALLASREAGVLYSLGKGRPRQTLEGRIAHWLKTLGLIHSFRVEAITKNSQLFQVWVKKSRNSAEVLITDVGFGVSQILPVLTLCYYVPEGSTILLEQPEIHLHPSVQAGLADVFIDAMKTRQIQIILESHSEHLLRRLQRRIAEEEITPDDAALYFCATERGESQLKPLKIDKFGSIMNWPKDFFGDEFGEITAINKAKLERKLKENA